MRFVGFERAILLSLGSSVVYGSALNASLPFSGSALNASPPSFDANAHCLGEVGNEHILLNNSYVFISNIFIHNFICSVS